MKGTTMNYARRAVMMMVCGAVAVVLAGCPDNSGDRLPGGRWHYVSVDAASADAPVFRASMKFEKPGSGDLGTFEYREERLLPDTAEGAASWHTSYYAKGYYRTASYGYPGASDIFTYWADTELNVDISEYAPLLTQRYDPETGVYTYTLEMAALGDTKAHSRAVLTVNSFDELVISWGEKVPAAAGRVQAAKAFSINEGISADTYVRGDDTLPEIGEETLDAQ
jgi:hypothetical protein